MTCEPENPLCAKFIPLLDDYFDGERIDPALQAELSAHLEVCDNCRADLEAMRMMREGLRSVPRVAALPSVRETVRSRLSPAHKRSPGQERMIRFINRPVPALAVMAVSILVIGSVGRLYSQYRTGPGLWPTVITEETPPVSDHISLVQRDGGLALPSNDPQALEAWFSERLLFSPPVPTWPWANLEGGRICFINGHRVARIQYSAEGRLFSLFVQYIGEKDPQKGPRNCDSGKNAYILEKQGYKAAYWDKDGFSYVLVAHESADPVFYNLQHGP